MADDSYYRLLAEVRKRENFAVVFRNTLEDVAGKVDFSHVKSCVAFGTGSGEREIEFARRLLPNLRSFTAVEPDPESVKVLRASIHKDGQLPGVEASVVETKIESWSGVDAGVDAVLLINVMLHVHADDRRALIQKLVGRQLNDAGLVVICDVDISVPSFHAALSQRLGKPMKDYNDTVKDMVAAGFRVVFEQDLEVYRDFSNPSDDIVKLVQLVNGCSESEVRATIDDVFSRQKLLVSPRKLGIFTK